MDNDNNVLKLHNAVENCPKIVKDYIDNLIYEKTDIRLELQKTQNKCDNYERLLDHWQKISELKQNIINESSNNEY